MKKKFKAAMARWFMRSVQPVLLGFMRWLTVGSDVEELILRPDLPESVRDPVDFADSPFTPFMLKAAMGAMTADPHMSRDLNACLLALRLDQISMPFQAMYASIMVRTKDAQEAFLQVSANLIVLGYTAGRMSWPGAPEVAMLDPASPFLAGGSELSGNFGGGIGSGRV